MRIDKITVYRVRIPFRFAFSHNLFNRTETRGLVVRITADNGVEGYGEGAPREYVTGETLGSSIEGALLLASRLKACEFDDFDQLKACFASLGDTRTAHLYPSAFCALETAALDLWAKSQGRPVWGLFTERPAAESFVYSAVLPLIRENNLLDLLGLVKNLEIRWVKLKISDKVPGVASLRHVRNILGDSVDIRIDANCAFDTASALAFIDQARRYNISSVEQPVPKHDWKGLKEVADRCGLPVLADESVCTLADARHLVENRVCHGFSVKLSKCGGMLNSLRMLDYAAEQGMICMISCHVGETAILSAAGRALAAVHNGCRHLEGSGSKYLLAEDIVETDISFGSQGLAPILNGPGLGIDVSDVRLARSCEPIDETP